MLFSQYKPEEGEEVPANYQLWGKSFVIWGGVFLLLMVAIVVYRHLSMDVPFGMDDDAPIRIEDLREEPIVPETDTLKNDN